MKAEMADVSHTTISPVISWHTVGTQKNRLDKYTSKLKHCGVFDYSFIVLLTFLFLPKKYIII